MATSSCSRALVGSFKRLKLSPTTPTIQHQLRQIHQSSQHAAPETALQTSSPAIEAELASIRLPKAVQATYLNPLKRSIPSGATKSAELQLRSYSVRNLELFADFALRAAYYLKLPATGPKPLPKKTERWTVPRSNFVHKKSQENFERITMQRLINVYGGHPETVAIWLAFLRKYQYYGVGLKANVFEYGGLETSKEMREEAEKIRKRIGGQDFETFAGKRLVRDPKPVMEAPFKASWGGAAASGAGTKPVTAGNVEVSDEHWRDVREKVWPRDEKGKVDRHGSAARQTWRTAMSGEERFKSLSEKKVGGSE